LYVDSDLIYAQIKTGDHLEQYSKTILKGKEKKYTSIITLLELEIIVKREISDYLSKEIKEVFKEKFPEIKILNFNEKTLEKSLELRKEYALGIFDSIHGATALLNDKKIASNDHIFERIPKLKIIKK
jgi:predicted nucleic acid-binding protein